MDREKEGSESAGEGIKCEGMEGRKFESFEVVHDLVYYAVPPRSKIWCHTRAHSRI